MCGVIGFACERPRADFGRIASDLLRALEYRGYDSTGAAIQNGAEVILRKGVGAPSQLVRALGIVDLPGRILCGQVRWATFGAVTVENSQPHAVACHARLYGAHNGNVTNCDQLKGWLTSEGHRVLSDNDGEMVVHAVEHFFARRIADGERDRKAAMRGAIAEAARRLQGSFAAVIVDPESETLWAIKQGSSLYFGLGSDETGGAFSIASSDLSSVLKLTQSILPLKEGEFVQYDATAYQVYSLNEPSIAIERAPVRSRLRAEDTALHAPFTTFMEQEIASQEELARDFATSAPDEAVERLLAAVEESLARGGRLFCVSCGSSYNAARAGALFFNELARADLLPLLPGEFRERASRSLRDGDLVFAISQSGETKDLIDVMNDVAAARRQIFRVAVVNNVNSTLAEEKCDLVLPLRCGPEVAVPATKSFTSQLLAFYGVALRLGERRADSIEWKRELIDRRDRLPSLPSLIRAASADCAALDEAADLLYLRPSLHLLATRMTGLAREGALKIREVVLNHAEGFEASEFKHGPNTILGFNTLYGPRELDALLRSGGPFLDGISAEAMQKLSTDYPLIYLTGPDPRDVQLTISQINTHKIRGAQTIAIAEESAPLRAAVEKAPADNPAYRALYIVLPETGDTLMTVFTATVALQRLALKMSLRKMAWLDSLGVVNHGVHPDVPKNVSKSITVD